MIIDKRKATLLGTLIVLITLSIMTVAVGAPPTTKPKIPPTITFISAVPVDAVKVKLTYELTSGDPVLKQWDIYSPCFTKEKIVSVSESYSLNPAQNRLRFTNHYGIGETRRVEIVLKVDYYSMIIGMLNYNLHWEPYQDSGTIEGPICPPDFVIPETPLGVIGSLTSLLAAAGLLAAFRRT